MNLEFLFFKKQRMRWFNNKLIWKSSSPISQLLVFQSQERILELNKLLSQMLLTLLRLMLMLSQMLKTQLLLQVRRKKEKSQQEKPENQPQQKVRSQENQLSKSMLMQLPRSELFTEERKPERMLLK
jgi:hypothetical protein